jgi:hypothetical protein
VHAETQAKMLVLHQGGRDRESGWMCLNQRRLGGRSAYEAIADGDFNLAWDLIGGEAIGDRGANGHYGIAQDSMRVLGSTAHVVYRPLEEPG